MPSSDSSSATRVFVLVVDDQIEVRSVMSAMLHCLGYSCLLAEDGAKAIDVYRRHSARIGLVILDLTMPGMCGREVLRALRRLNGGVPVVLSSGEDEKQVAAVAAEGADGYLLKPVCMAELEAKIVDVLGAHQRKNPGA